MIASLSMGAARAGIDADEPEVGRDRLDAREVAIAARKDVDFVAETCELAGKFEDVDVHAAGGAPAEGCKRAGMG